MNSRSQNIILVYYLLDLVMLTVSFFTVLQFKYEVRPPEYILSVYVTLLVTWFIILLVNDSERLFLREKLWKRLRMQLMNFLIFIGLVSSVIFALKLGYFSRLQTYGTIGLFFILKTIGFYVVFLWLAQRRKKGRQLARVLVIGAGRVGCKFYNFTEENREMGYQVIGFLEDKKEEKPCEIQDKILGVIEDIPEILDKELIDEVVIALPLVERELLKTIIGISEFYGKRIRMIPDFYRLIDRRFRLTSVGEIPMINVREIPLDNFRNFLSKRIFDVLGASIGLICFLPVMLIIALLIKMDSHGPVFYRPVRVSRGGKKFKMLKFRSMYVDKDLVKIPGSTVKNDPRITRLGKILRKTNIDELPQLWNVLTNRMSLVGPRPHRVDLNADLQHSVVGYMVRHYIKPGITGWAQVSGWRGPTATPEQRRQRTHHDIWYIENWTFWLDIKIIWLTIFGKNAYKNAF